MDMDWNAKWDWENLVACSKGIESPKDMQLADWTIVDDGEIHAGSFNLSAGGDSSSGASGSDGRHSSSAKSSISASTDSSSKDGMHTSIFNLSTSEGSGNFSKKIKLNGIELSGASPTPETSIGSAEALLGLKLGKRTYFENSSGGGAVNGSSFSVVPTQSITAQRKTRASGQYAPVCCQVEGCAVDLLLAKEYHRKHRVCDSHSKCPKVIVGGRERRFCQQCSRFHSLSEFDEKKRSCRRRLSDHNARRRKPQQDTMQFNPSRLSTPFYGGIQQMNFLLNSSVPLANSGWNNSKFSLTKGCLLKSDGDGGTDEQLSMPGFRVPQAINMQNAANGFAVLNTVSKGSPITSVDAAPEYGRALSLLSTSSWNPCVPESHHQLHENGSSIIHPMAHGIPEGLPFSSSDFWPTGHQVQSLGMFKTPYDADLYSNVWN